jgi:hypothetical protein
MRGTGSYQRCNQALMAALESFPSPPGMKTPPMYAFQFATIPFRTSRLARKAKRLRPNSDVFGSGRSRSTPGRIFWRSGPQGLSSDPHGLLPTRKICVPTIRFRCRPSRFRSRPPAFRFRPSRFGLRRSRFGLRPSGFTFRTQRNLVVGECPV